MDRAVNVAVAVRGRVYGCAVETNDRAIINGKGSGDLRGGRVEAGQVEDKRVEVCAGGSVAAISVRADPRGRGQVAAPAQAARIGNPEGARPAEHAQKASSADRQTRRERYARIVHARAEECRNRLYFAGCHVAGRRVMGLLTTALAGVEWQPSSLSRWH